MAYWWFALAFALLAGFGGAAFAGYRALEAWRSFRGLRRAVGEGLGDVRAGIGAAERRADELPERVAAVLDAQARLSRSLAVARLLATAATDAAAPVVRARTLLPRR